MGGGLRQLEFFQVLMTSQDGGAPGKRACLAGWLVGNLNVFTKLMPELDPYQGRLLLDVIRLWGRVIPYTLGPTELPHIVMPEEASKVRALFEDTATIARVVNIFRTILPHEAHNRERDEAIVCALRAFCEEKSDEIERLSAIGIFEAQRWLFDGLCWHLKQLLRVILGDRLMERFTTEYDIQMSELRLMHDLAAAPLQ